MEASQARTGEPEGISSVSLGPLEKIPGEQERKRGRATGAGWSHWRAGSSGVRMWGRLERNCLLSVQPFVFYSLVLGERQHPLMKWRLQLWGQLVEFSYEALGMGLFHPCSPSHPAEGRDTQPLTHLPGLPGAQKSWEPEAHGAESSLLLQSQREKQPSPVLGILNESENALAGEGGATGPGPAALGTSQGQQGHAPPGRERRGPEK